MVWGFCGKNLLARCGFRVEVKQKFEFFRSKERSLVCVQGLVLN